MCLGKRKRSRCEYFVKQSSKRLLIKHTSHKMKTLATDVKKLCCETVIKQQICLASRPTLRAYYYHYTSLNYCQSSQHLLFCYKKQQSLAILHLMPFPQLSFLWNSIEPDLRSASSLASFCPSDHCIDQIH